MPAGKRTAASRIPHLVLLAAGLFVAGCGNDATKPEDTSWVRGRVDAGGTASAGIPAPSTFGAETVTLNRIAAGGTLEVVSLKSVQAGASGEFTIETTQNRTRNLVLVAATDPLILKAVVSAEVNHGTTVQSPPMNVETTAEADVYIEIVARGTQGIVTFADVAEYVSAELAASVVTGAVTPARVAAALESEATIRITLLGDPPLNVTGAGLSAIAAGRAEARAAFDAEMLVANGNEAALAAAARHHVSAVVAVYEEAGVDVAALARIREASARAFVMAAAEWPAAGKLAAIRGSALIRAELIARAVAAQWVTVGASASQKALIESRGASLVASIRAALTAGAIESAFVAYHDAAIAEFKGVLDAHAALIAAADLSINGANGPRDTLLKNVEEAASTTALVGAYSTFFTETRNIAETILVGQTAVELNASTQVLVLTNMSLG